MDTKSIDWSKAPEGAKGFAEIGLSGSPVWFGDNWYEYVNGARYNFARYRDGDCHYAPDEMVNIRRKPEQIEPEWDGKGLPPVGTTCEANVPQRVHRMSGVTGYAWRKVEVCKSGMPGAEGECLVFDLETTAPCWADELRPLRSPEWIAYEKERAAVGSMLRIMKSTWGFVTAEMASEDERLEAMARQLYRHGYARPPELKPGGLALVVESELPTNLHRVVELVKVAHGTEIELPGGRIIGNPDGKRCWIIKGDLAARGSDSGLISTTDYAAIDEARLMAIPGKEVEP